MLLLIHVSQGKIANYYNQRVLRILCSCISSSQITSTPGLQVWKRLMRHLCELQTDREVGERWRGTLWDDLHCHLCLSCLFSIHWHKVINAFPMFLFNFEQSWAKAFWEWVGCCIYFKESLSTLLNLFLSLIANLFLWQSLELEMSVCFRELSNTFNWMHPGS